MCDDCGWDGTAFVVVVVLLLWFLFLLFLCFLLFLWTYLIAWCGGLILAASFASICSQCFHEISTQKADRE